MDTRSSEQAPELSIDGRIATIRLRRSHVGNRLELVSASLEEIIASRRFRAGG